MPELITIEEAARITGFPSEDIQYWAKSHKITSYSVTRDSRLVDLGHQNAGCSQTLRYILRQIVLPV